jgi:hypothetical protein
MAIGKGVHTVQPEVVSAHHRRYNTSFKIEAAVLHTSDDPVLLLIREIKNLPGIRMTGLENDSRQERNSVIFVIKNEDMPWEGSNGLNSKILELFKNYGEDLTDGGEVRAIDVLHIVVHE